MKKMPEWFEEYKKHIGDLYLNMFDVVELIDMTEDEDDCYFKVRGSDGEIFEISCVVGLIKLRDMISVSDYVKLIYWREKNVLDYLED